MGRFWVVLGAVLEGKLGLKPFVLNGFVKIDVFEKESSQDPSWADLGSIWVAKGGPRGGLLETKLGSKRVRKSEAKKGLVLGGLGGGGPAFAAG